MQNHTFWTLVAILASSLPSTDLLAMDYLENPADFELFDTIRPQSELIFCEKYYFATNKQCFQLKYLIKISNFRLFVTSWLPFQVKFTCICCKSYPLHIQRFAQGRWPAKSTKISKSAHPVAPPQPPRDLGICSSDLQPALEIQAPVPSDLQPSPEIQATSNSTKSASASSFDHQAAAPNQHQLPVSTTRQQHQNQHQLPVSTTRQQDQISISFQLPPPDSSTKPPSASSFHHQAAAPHQPAPSKASSQPAVNSTYLPHPHHGSQVGCYLDILWLFSSIIF